MNTTVTSEKTDDNKVVATIVVAAEDVNKAVAKTYKDIARRYNFQGFRRGKAPRPVVDGLIGKDAVLAQATEEILNEVQPKVLDELDLVAIEQPSFGDDPEIVEEGKDYQVVMTVTVMPELELENYDAPSINMPPKEVTDAEIDLQIDQLLSYQTTYEDEDTDRACEAGDVVSVDIIDKEGASHLAGEGRTFALNTNGGLNDDLVNGIVGMKPGETKEITWTVSHEHDGEKVEHTFSVEVKLNAIKKAVTPELTEEFVKNSFGFDKIEELRDAIKEELAQDKELSLPRLKEDRVVEAMGEKLILDEVPEAYLNQVMNELAGEFLQQLQGRGMTLDGYLAASGTKMEQFMEDLRHQANDRARQSLMLDSLVKQLGITAGEEDILAEIEKAGVKDAKDLLEQLRGEGRLPGIREAIRRSKAVDWLIENANVTEVDEIAERRAAEASEDAE